MALEILRRNSTFPDVMAEVEKEGLVYSDGLSYVCSSFVTGLYKRAGILGDVEIQVSVSS